MRNLKRGIILSGMIITAIAAACLGQQLEIHHIDVGQGDSTLIVGANGKTILIDAGDRYKGVNEVIPYLEELGVKRLDFVIASHMDADHIGGLDEVLESDYIRKVKKVLDNGSSSPTDSDEFKDYLKAVQQRVGARTTIKPGRKFKLGDGASATCIYSNGKSIRGGKIQVTDENDKSVCLLIDYDFFSYFIGGDIGGGGTGHEDVESFVAPKVGDVDVLRVNHHGSSSSSNAFFLDTLSPEAAIISVGENPKTWSHPTEDVLDRLYGRNIDVMQTGAGHNPGGKVMGDVVVIVKRGKKYWIDGSVRTKDKYIRKNNCAPVADFTFNIDGKTVTLDASPGADDGKIKHYFWNFGDGETDSGKKMSSPAHTYSKQGKYDVFLSVLDNFGISGVTTRTIAVGEKEQKSISVSAFADPANPKRYSHVKIHVTVKDQSGNPLGNASVKTVAHYKTTDTTKHGTTSGDGKCVIDYYIAGATAGFKVWVDVAVTYKEMKAYAGTSFTPRD